MLPVPHVTQTPGMVRVVASLVAVGHQIAGSSPAAPPHGACCRCGDRPVDAPGGIKQGKQVRVPVGSD